MHRAIKPTPDSLKWLIGLPQISDYVSWSQDKIIRMAIKYGFPLHKLPYRCGRNWAYQVTTAEIEWWLAKSRAQGREKILQTARGRAMAVREREPAMGSVEK